MPSFNQLAKDWPTIGLFLLTFYVVTITAFIPGAGGNTLFRTLSQAIVITGLVGMALANHYRDLAEKTIQNTRLMLENKALEK